ncbi:MAG: hypothetical protein IJ086_07380 [Clostridium sp.]|nr:hypothetical protein [Clostridium sp.]MBQ8998490.1 hypothetical protein [Clostridium sp.]
MLIELRRNKILINNEEVPEEKLFSVKKYSQRNIVRELDFRKNDLRDIDNLTIINKSGKNYDLVSTNDWNCTLRTSQKVIVEKGFIPYMSQKYI